MGCDIHIYREKLVDGKWVTGDTWTKHEECDNDEEAYWSHSEVGGDRNYSLFRALAQVRCYRDTPKASFPEMGMPETASKEVTREERRWDGDGHTHSHLSLNQLKHLQFFAKGEMVTISGFKFREDLDELNESIASGNPNWDLLHPYYENNPCDSRFKAFKIEVPVSYGYSAQLQEIIDGLEEIGGDDQRIVFWFDN
jgi:hypothetical protein